MNTLLAIYIVAVWTSSGSHPTTIRWHEFQLPQHFFSRSLCEDYRTGFGRGVTSPESKVFQWVADPKVPVVFARDSRTPARIGEFAASRCGPWEPNPSEGQEL